MGEIRLGPKLVFILLSSIATRFNCAFPVEGWLRLLRRKSNTLAFAAEACKDPSDSD